MVFRSHPHRRTLWVLHRWCKELGRRSLIGCCLPGVLLCMDDLEDKLRKPCNILCWKILLLHIKYPLAFNSILKNLELQYEVIECWWAACCDLDTLSSDVLQRLEYSGVQRLWSSSWPVRVFKGKGLALVGDSVTHVMSSFSLFLGIRSCNANMARVSWQVLDGKTHIKPNRGECGSE